MEFSESGTSPVWDASLPSTYLANCRPVRSSALTPLRPGFSSPDAYVCCRTYGAAPGVHTAALSTISTQGSNDMDVLLAIQVRDFARGETLTDAIVPLTALGGRLVAWRSESNGAPIQAKFKVQTEDERDDFVTAALKIPGVSLGRRASQ
jgi:hypothetical protein